MTCILELNDADLTLYRDDAVVHRAPGCAVVLGDDVRFGNDAMALSRIHPRQTHQQYFARLNTDPVASPGPRVRHHADLVYLHLRALKGIIDEQGGSVLLTVPGVLTADQLGVLLGVMQEAGIGVSGFVDSAVAAVCRQPGEGRVWHLDVHLQRAVITELDLDASVSKRAAYEVPDCGLSRLLDGWVNVVADRFVRETRFDPLHAAATEQQVFDQIYHWLEHAAARADLVIEVNQAEQTRRVDIARASLEDKAAQRLAPLLDVIPGGGARVCLTPRAARLPGLQTLLAGAGAEPVAVPADALARGCLDNLSRICADEDGLRLVTRLPHAGGAGEAPTAGPPRLDMPAATHALRDGTATPLSALASRLGLDPQAPGYGVRPGDRVSVDGADYLIIHVER